MNKSNIYNYALLVKNNIEDKKSRYILYMLYDNFVDSALSLMETDERVRKDLLSEVTTLATIAPTIDYFKTIKPDDHIYSIVDKIDELINEIGQLTGDERKAKQEELANLLELNRENMK